MPEAMGPHPKGPEAMGPHPKGPEAMGPQAKGPKATGPDGTETVSAGAWQVATVDSVHTESPRVKLFRLKLPVPGKFQAGQYYDIRLSAPDGYQAQRSYSISSSPVEPDVIELTIELILDGEVSSYFHEAVEKGERIELRGPIGGHFTWTPDYTGPVLLVAGGSGIAPLMSILRHRRTVGASSQMLLMFSVRAASDILFRRELEEMARADASFKLVITLTRAAPKSWTGQIRRIDRKMIDTAFKMVAAGAGVSDAESEEFDRATTHQPTFGRAYICGGTGFVESIAGYLLDTGMEYGEIRTERFGP
ncbi:MAG: FAD-binding oxidoreductase [Chloroflexi bacterium]|nr:FAD-binding oxidoreductase [Chloroflexota bacterium]